MFNFIRKWFAQLRKTQSRSLLLDDEVFAKSAAIDEQDGILTKWLKERDRRQDEILTKWLEERKRQPPGGGASSPI